MTTNVEKSSDFLINYPFSLLDVDGSLEMWQDLYKPCIDLIESNINNSGNDSISIFKYHNFAFNNAFEQRIADLVVCEVEEKSSNPVTNSNRIILNKPKEKIEEQYSDVLEKEDYNLKITFILTNKTQHPLKFMQFLKLSGEVKNFTELIHKKELKQYSEVIPQVIFISLFGFEASIGDYMRDNLHGKLNRNISIIVVPPVENNLWNNYLVENPRDGNNNFLKHKSGITFEDFKHLKRNGNANQVQVKRMESYYKDLKETQDISNYNSKRTIIWADILDIENSSKLLDVRNSKKLIKEHGIE